MRFFNNANFDFMSSRKYAYFASAVLILTGVIFYFVRGGFNWGVDFQGGIKLQVKFENPLTIKDLETVRGKLQATAKSLGKENNTIVVQKKLPDFIREKELLLQKARRENKIFTDYEEVMTFLAIPENLKANFLKHFSLDDREQKKDAININTSSIEVLRSQISNLMTQNEVENFKTTLTEIFAENPFIIEGVSLVGPAVGKKYQQSAFWAIFFALIGILIYVSFRFEFIYSIGAIVALAHDVLITLSVLIVLNKEIDLSVVVALLTLVGYSINDTIVVDDRIRESKKLVKGTIETVINTAINSTLARTIMTALTTFVAVLALFLFGGEGLRVFSLAFLVGIITGTYSSIFIAAPIVLDFEKRRA